jgi:hypothetical protein
METKFYPMRGDYGKKGRENANTKAPRGFRFSSWSPFPLLLLNYVLSFSINGFSKPKRRKLLWLQKSQ